MELDVGATIMQPMITTLLDTLLKPKLEKIKFQNNLNENEVKNIVDSFQEYLNRGYNTHLLMNTIVFRNNPIDMYELYCPLTIENESETILVDNFPNDFINKYKKIVITDDAGMGKSTLLKWMFVNCIHFKKKIPIFIELRKLSNNNKVIQQIFSELNNLDEKVNEGLVFNMLKEGDFVFFFDGYDEVPSQSKSEVTDDLKKFISRAGNNNFILTSRPQSTIGTFVDFNEFKIKPLEIEEAFSLIKKYDRSKLYSEKLISLISDKSNLTDLNEFLTNPLMISLLYKGYEYKQTIPFKKNLFYRQVYDALYEEHDIFKDGGFERTKSSMLDSDKFHIILRALGYLTFRLGKIEYSRDEITEYIRKAKHLTGIDFTINNFLSDLISNVPLFYKDGLLYRWKHKSLQDYFAAQFICIDTKGKQNEILINLYKSNNIHNHLNILDLCYDIDYKSFKKTIVLDILTEAEDHINYLKHKWNVDTSAHKKMASVLFWRKYFIVYNPMLKDHGLKKSDNVRNVFIKADEILNAKFKDDISEYPQKLMSKNTESSFILAMYENPKAKILKLLKDKGEDIFYSKSSSENKVIEMTDVKPIDEFLKSTNVNATCIQLNFSYFKNIGSDNEELANTILDYIVDKEFGEEHFLFEEKVTSRKNEIKKEISLEIQESNIYDFL